MSELEVTYDSMDAVPTEFASLYTERDGKAVLTGIKGIKTEADIRALKVVTDKERARARELEGKLKRFEKLGDQDPEELLKLREEIEVLRAGGSSAAGGEDAVAKRIQAGINSAVNPMKRELDALKAERDAAAAERDAARDTIRTSTLRSELTKAALGAKVTPEAMDDVLMYQSIFEIGEDGRPVTKDGVGVTPGLSPEVWMAEMRDKGRPWFGMSTGGGARGSGGSGTVGPNPFKRDTFNFTAASLMIRNDPAKAKQYANAAFPGLSPQDALKAASRPVGR